MSAPWAAVPAGRGSGVAARCAADPRRAERGMSMLEMIVALGIVTIVLVIAGAMLVQLSRQVQTQGLRTPAVGGVTDLAMDHMERDLREATSVDVHDDAGSAPELVLSQVDGATIRWHLDGTSLRRQRAPRHGDPFEREVAPHVALVEWHQRSGHLLDVVMRRKDEIVRQRTVLLRDLGHAAPAGDEDSP